MLENKLGMSADKAEKGYLSGMMVFDFLAKYAGYRGLCRRGFSDV